MGDFVFIGLVVGIILGVVIQRGGFCMYNGFANMVITKDYRIIRAAIWAFLVTLIGFHLMQSLGIAKMDPKPFFWSGSIVGAAVFAIGMVLAGGCIVGSPLKAASGKMGYWFTVLGMGIGGWTVIWGPLAAFRKDSLQEATKVMMSGKNPTLNGFLFGVNRWIIVVILAGVCIWLLKKLKNDAPGQEKQKISFFKSLWSPVAIGIGLAIGEMIALASGKSPAGFGGFIKGWALYFKLLLSGKLPFDWPVTFVTGMLIGVFISALIAKEFRIIWPRWNQIPRLFTGGLLMGMGAVTAAGGCNIAHIISHMPQLSIGSFVSGATQVIVVVILLRVFFLKKLTPQ
ncbi:MAG: YeeE/YedE family protein [Elusimicrobiota bacterium]